MFALQINKSKLVNLLYKSKLVTFSQAKTPSKSFPQTIKLIFQSGLLESLQWSIQEKKDTFHFSSEEDESQKLFKRSRLVPPSTCTSNTQINTSFREKIQTLQNDNSREVLQMAQILQGHFALTVQRIQRALQAKKARSSSNTSKNMHSLKKTLRLLRPISQALIPVSDHQMDTQQPPALTVGSKATARRVFSTSADAVWAECPGHH